MNCNAFMMRRVYHAGKAGGLEGFGPWEGHLEKKHRILKKNHSACIWCVGGVTEGTNFGQSRFGHPDLPILLGILVLARQILANPFLANPFRSVYVCVMVGPQRWGPKGGVPKGGVPKGGALKGGAHFRSFCLSLVSSRGILVVFEAPEPSDVRVWSSLVVVEGPKPTTTQPHTL